MIAVDDFLDSLGQRRALPHDGFSHERTFKGETNHWLTPPDLLAALGPFDLDPCAAPRPRPWPTATTMWSLPEEDGYAREWRGRVWLNPPYGPAAARWLYRLRRHGDGIAFVFARTETAMFTRHVWDHAAALLFLRGRVKFRRPDGQTAAPATAPSVLIAYGTKNADALASSQLSGGLCVVRR